MRSSPSSKLSHYLLRSTAIVCLSSGILLSNPLHAHSTPAWTSAATFGGTGSDSGNAVKIDRDGNRYVAGAFSATAYFPMLAGDAQDQSARKELTSEGGTDVFLAKYDRSGNLQWLTKAGGAGDDSAFDLAFDAARNVYVTGVFTDFATFRGIDGTEKTVSGLGHTIFLAKYTPSGVLAWVQTGTTAFPGAENSGFGVAVEPKRGSIYLTGLSQLETTFSSSNGTTHSISGPWTWHMVLVKYDTAGNFRWGASNQAAPNSIPQRVAVDAHDNVYATGWMEGQTTFYSNDGHDLTVDGFSGPVQQFPDYPDDAFVVKYDVNGNVKWVNHIGGYKAIGTDIATSRDGKVSVTGFIGNIADSPTQAATIVTSQPGGKDINLGGGMFTNPYNKDVFVATYDGAGVLLGAKRFGGVKDEGGSAIAYDRHGNMIVAGIFQDTIEIEGRTLTRKDPSNLFVAKFTRSERNRDAEDGTDAGGQHGFAPDRLDWIKEADGPFVGGFERSLRICLAGHGDVLVTGAYQPAARFDNFKLNSAGLDDGFLALLRTAEPGKDEHEDDPEFDQD